MKAHSGHVGTSGLQAHSLGTVYPFGVVSKGDRMFFSVDYRKPLREEMARLPHFTFESAFRLSMLRRVVEFLGEDDSNIRFSISTDRPAGRELKFSTDNPVMAWEHIRTFKPLSPDYLGASLLSCVDDGRAYQLVSLGDGSYTLWGELTL